MKGEGAVARYRKKPIVVEAEQFFPDKQPWPKGVEGYWVEGNGYIVWIETLEGNMSVAPGDWIVTGISGELYPVKPYIFEATYESCGD